MIITRTWLSEWIDIGDKSLEDLVQALNSIGIEVDKSSVLKAPDKIVVGFVKEKIKHKDSDKLSICQVDVGNKILQIVCGASNVAAGEFVAVALEGAKMPNGVEIKKAKLRGIDSFGMLCSSSELGFAKTNEGIMLLDESIGELKLGQALNSYPLFNDELIELELTPNRGDCLSIYGIARDLAVVWNLDLKEANAFKESENVLGIGRILRIAAAEELNTLFNYRAIELKEKLETKLLLSLRLAQIGVLSSNAVENLIHYATHSTGVLFNAYDFNKLSKDNEKITLNFNKMPTGETEVLCQENLLSISGIYQEEDSKCTQDSKILIIEAHYTDPSIIALAKNYYKKQDEKTFYRSFRGSEPRLNLGMDFLLTCIKKNPNLTIYNSSQQITACKQNPIINVNIENLNKIIGQEFNKDEILRILKKLGFELILLEENKIINVKAPLHRSDIKNLADICEEIVRIIGIDNIHSKPLEFTETKRLNDTFISYKNLLNLRLRAVSNGYFESLHYVLDNKEELENFGFTTLKLKLVNPIANELNTLRSTLLNHLLNAASLNVKNSKKIVKLFESGIVFNSLNEQCNRIAFIHCGFKEEAKISNRAKPVLVSFYDFLLDLKNIIGDFKLKQSDYGFLSPYEQAHLYIDSIKVGFVGRLHLKIENQKDLLKTYVCELDLDLLKEKNKTARVYSKFPSISRDLSILIPKDFAYEQIKTNIENLKLDILENFRIVDIYNDENLKDVYSLTINFIFRDINKTLEDFEVQNCMEKILENLQQLGLKLR